MDRSRNVTGQETVTPPPEVVGRALAVRSMLDVVQPLAVEARAAVSRAEGHESLAFAEAKARALEGSVAKLRGALAETGLFA